MDCELSRENIFTSWQDNYGKAICFECKPMIDSVYTMRAEMKTVDLYKVSYYVQTAEDLLLECGLQVHTKNMSDKQTEQFVKLFEKLIKIVNSNNLRCILSYTILLKLNKRFNKADYYGPPIFLVRQIYLHLLSSSQA